MKQSDIEWAVLQARRWLNPSTGLQGRGNQKKLRMARALLELHAQFEAVRKKLEGLKK